MPPLAIEWSSWANHAMPSDYHRVFICRLPGPCVIMLQWDINQKPIASQPEASRTKADSVRPIRLAWLNNKEQNTSAPDMGLEPIIGPQIKSEEKSSIRNLFQFREVSPTNWRWQYTPNQTGLIEQEGAKYKRARYGTWTHDPQIKSLMLYRLS